MMPQPNQTTEQNKQIVQRYLEECWNQGNLNKASEYLTDQVRSYDPAFPNMQAGIQGARNHIETCRRGFPDLKITIEDMIAERDEVVVHWTVRGTHRGEFSGLQPTQRNATVEGTTINRMEGAKIAEAHSYWNVASLMAQLGVVQTTKEAVSTAR